MARNLRLAQPRRIFFAQIGWLRTYVSSKTAASTRSSRGIARGRSPLFAKSFSPTGPFFVPPALKSARRALTTSPPRLLFARLARGLDFFLAWLAGCMGSRLARLHRQIRDIPASARRRFFGDGGSFQTQRARNPRPIAG
jgi:hypothetical protein